MDELEALTDAAMPDLEEILDARWKSVRKASPAESSGTE